MNVMLLCAGEGQRLRPYTADTPKPLIPFLGVPLCLYSLSLIDRLAVDNLVVNSYHLADKIQKFFYSLEFKYKKLCLVRETTLLGSGGGIHNAKEHLIGRGDFIVMNGDEVILPHQFGLISKMIEFHKDHKGIATLLTMNHPETGKKFGGAWADKDSKVQQFSKTPIEGLTGHHFVGVWILSDRVFKYFHSEIKDENILYETLTKAMAAGEKVYCYQQPMVWSEIGNPNDFIEAAKEYVKNVEPNPTEYWKDYLLQTIRWFGKTQFVIENDYPELRQQIQDIYPKWKSGSL